MRHFGTVESSSNFEGSEHTRHERGGVARVGPLAELTDDRDAKPEDLLQPGQKVEVRIIRVDIDERKIGLSFVHSDFAENDFQSVASRTYSDQSDRSTTQ